jgi:hypothetical protein
MVHFRFRKKIRPTATAPTSKRVVALGPVLTTAGAAAVVELLPPISLENMEARLDVTLEGMAEVRSDTPLGPFPNWLDPLKELETGEAELAAAVAAAVLGSVIASGSLYE